MSSSREHVLELELVKALAKLGVREELHAASYARERKRRANACEIVIAIVVLASAARIADLLAATTIACALEVGESLLLALLSFVLSRK